MFYDDNTVNGAYKRIFGNKRMCIQLRVNFSSHIAACGYMRTKIYT